MKIKVSVIPKMKYLMKKYPLQKGHPSKRSVRKLTIRKVEKSIRMITSVLLKGFTIIFVLIALIFISSELLDSRYTIQQIHVPSVLEANGYSGEVVANRISESLIAIMKTERFSEEAALYSNAFDQDDISVDIVGTGIPIRSIIHMFGEVLGVDGQKIIKGDIVLDGDTAILTIKVNSNDPLRYQIPFDGSYEKIVTQITTKSAESILMYSSPYVLARHYLNRDAEGNRRLSKFLFDRALNDTKLEPLAYFSLAGSLLTERKPAAAETILREGLSKAPNDINLNAALGMMLQEQNKTKECLVQQKKVISMLTRSTTRLRRTLAFSNLALAYRINNQIDSALFFFDKALEIDPDAGVVYVNLARTHLINRQDTAQFLKYFEVAVKKGMADRLRKAYDLKGMMSHPRVIELLNE